MAPAEMADRFACQYERADGSDAPPGKMGLGTAYIAGFATASSTALKPSARWTPTFRTRLRKFSSWPGRSRLAISHRLALCPGGSWMKTGRCGARAYRPGATFMPAPSCSMPIRDCTGGFRLWRAEVVLHAARPHPLQWLCLPGRDGYICPPPGLRFREIPIYFADRRWGKSKMNFRIQAEAALRVWQLPPQYKDLHT
jgi:dolichol-phosphate mannosyltransferase